MALPIHFAGSEMATSEVSGRRKSGSRSNHLPAVGNSCNRWGRSPISTWGTSIQAQVLRLRRARPGLAVVVRVMLPPPCQDIAGRLAGPNPTFTSTILRTDVVDSAVSNLPRCFSRIVDVTP